LDSANHLIAKKLIITEKLDGSNLCMTGDDVFARSHASSPTHSSFSRAKQVHSCVKHLIHGGLQIFMEYCEAVHTIVYDEGLPSAFHLIGIFEPATNLWLPWVALEMSAKKLSSVGVPFVTVPVLARISVTSEAALEKVTLDCFRKPSQYGSEIEGVVVRVAGSFEPQEFPLSVAKYVRANHVAGEHWKKGTYTPQRIA